MVAVSVAARNLRGYIPSELGSLTYLRRLNLHGNNLFGPIPDQLFNATSLHSLYRDRLDEAFNYRSAEGRPLMLSDLQPVQPPVPGRRYPPKLIVNAAVNMQGSQRNRRARGADYFVFTHSRVGSDATGYAPTRNYEDAEPQVRSTDKRCR